MLDEYVWMNRHVALQFGLPFVDLRAGTVVCCGVLRCAAVWGVLEFFYFFSSQSS